MSSMLWKSEPNVSHVIQWDEVPIQEDATYEEMPLQILGWKLKVLRKIEIPFVMVLWQHHGIEDSTWELESEILERYLHLFSSWDMIPKFRGRNFFKEEGVVRPTFIFL